MRSRAGRVAGASAGGASQPREPHASAWGQGAEKKIRSFGEAAQSSRAGGMRSGGIVSPLRGSARFRGELSPGSRPGFLGLCRLSEAPVMREPAGAVLRRGRRGNVSAYRPVPARIENADTRRAFLSALCSCGVMRSRAGLCRLSEAPHCGNAAGAALRRGRRAGGLVSLPRGARRGR